MQCVSILIDMAYLNVQNQNKNKKKVKKIKIDLLTVPANHLDNEPTRCLIWLVLNMAFASLDRHVFVTRITQAAFEDRKNRLRPISMLYRLDD